MLIGRACRVGGTDARALTGASPPDGLGQAGVIRMTDWSRELRRLRQANAEVALVMAIHEQADRICHEALVAMGQRPAAKASSAASTDVRIELGADIRSISLVAESGERGRGRA